MNDYLATAYARWYNNEVDLGDQPQMRIEKILNEATVPNIDDADFDHEVIQYVEAETNLKDDDGSPLIIYLAYRRDSDIGSEEARMIYLAPTEGWQEVPGVEKYVREVSAELYRENMADALADEDLL